MDITEREYPFDASDFDDRLEGCDPVVPIENERSDSFGDDDDFYRPLEDY